MVALRLLRSHYVRPFLAAQELIFTLSNGGNFGIPATPGFEGYIIAQANFQYCHGFAFISDVGAQKLAEGYLAISLDAPASQPDRQRRRERRPLDPSLVNTKKGELRLPPFLFQPHLHPLRQRFSDNLIQYLWYAVTDFPPRPKTRRGFTGMLKRVSALCAFGLALSAVSLQAQDLFVLPGTGATNGEVQAFVTNPLTTFRTFDAGAGSFALLPNLDASKFFVVASSTTNSILATDRTFLAPALVANLPTPATQALITPDGKLLAVAAGTVHLFNTTTNAELVSGGISQGSGINTFAIAASLDSTTIFALGSEATPEPANSRQSAPPTTPSLPLCHYRTVATAVSVGPNGLVYVSLPEPDPGG